MACLKDTGLSTCGYKGCGPCELPNYEGKERAIVAEYLHWRFGKGTLAHVSLDLGAHVGLWSVFLANEYTHYGVGVIYAFEPNTVSYKALCENAELLRSRGINGVVPVCAAAWNVNAKLALHTDSGPARHYVTNQIDLQLKNGEKLSAAPSCNGIAIDNIPTTDNGPKTLDFVKVDVEGAELNAMNGMANTIKANDRLLVLIEYYREHFGRYGYGIKEMTTFMTTNGLQFARPVDEINVNKVTAQGGIAKIFFTKGDSPWR